MLKPTEWATQLLMVFGTYIILFFQMKVQMISLEKSGRKTYRSHSHVHHRVVVSKIEYSVKLPVTINLLMIGIYAVSVHVEVSDW